MKEIGGEEERVLSGIPVYYFSLFRAPSSICKSTEKCTCDFLWEGVDEGRGSHLVSWEAVSHLINQGGLKIGNLRIRNRALLAKWLWCFALEPKSLWRRIIVSKHNSSF